MRYDKLRLMSLMAIALSVCVLTITPLAKQAPAPARDNAAGSRGNARIRGRVLAADTGAPLRRATVSLASSTTASADQAGNGAPTGPALVTAGNGTYGATSNFTNITTSDRLVATDAEGRFEFSDLAAGRYTLAAAKGGYVTLLFGERRLRDGGRPIDLANGQTIEGVTFGLPQAGVIVARVTDEFGDPLNAITVEAQQVRYSGGERRLTTISGASIAGLTTTNDAGEMRIHGLPPGEYYVVAGQGVDSRFALAGSGRVYVATYFPGSTVASDAQLVKVGAGQETPVTIGMRAARITRISGRVVHADGTQFVPQRLTITREVGDSWTSAVMAFLGDGTFAMPRFVPGEYWLEAIDAPRDNPSGPREFARMPLQVTGDDLTDVVVVTKPIQPLKGRVVFDTGAPPAGLRPNALRLATTSTSMSSWRNGTATFREGWNFEIAAAIGTGVFRLMPPSSGWFLKAVVLDGREITDTPVDFEGINRASDLQVVLTQKNASLTGAVVNAAGAQVSDYSVVLFAEDSAQRTPRTRLTGLGRPDQSGRFKIEGLPPGRYLAVAVEPIETGEERDPAFLQSASAGATQLTLGEGESRALDLTLFVK